MKLKVSGKNSSQWTDDKIQLQLESRIYERIYAKNL